MQEFFGSRAVECTVAGKDNEKIVFKRVSKSYGAYLENYVYSGLLQDDTKLVNGDVVENDGKTFFLVARRSSFFSEIGKLIRCNAVCSLIRKVKQYSGHDFIGYKDESTEGVKCNYRSISGKMSLYDPGLLPTTTLKLIIPKLTVQLHDRVKLNEKVYCIDYIDDVTNDGVLTLQCSPDNGSSK